MPQRRVTRFRSEVRKDLFRISLAIPKDAEAWLQSLSNEMKATGGYKLPKSYILRSVLAAMMRLKIDVSGVRSEAELEKRLLAAIRHYGGGTSP